MTTANFDPLDAINRLIERAAQNLRIEKLLIQLGLDPNNVSVEAIVERLLDIAAANVNFANLLALCGAAFFASTLLMRTMVPLRVMGMISNAFFIGYGALAASASTFFMYACLLPINGVRLYQMLGLVKKARISAQGDLSMEWLRPFMTSRKYKDGELLFRKGDAAKEMYLIVTGKFRVVELDVQLPPGQIMGELGFLTPNNKRTQSVECLEKGEVLTIDYDKLLEVYFQNPEFGYYFLRLTSQRLLQNIQRLEGVIEQNRNKIQALEASKDKA